MFGVKQANAACNPAECNSPPYVKTCQYEDWGPEYQCLAKCCVIPAGGGGGSPTPPPGPGYQYHSCPAGQALSCGTPAEAVNEVKYSCQYNSFCDTYFFPMKFNGDCGVPKYNCQWNCNCCPFGTLRSCNSGSTYTTNVTLNVCAQGDHECNNNRTAALMSCPNHHDDIYQSNQLISENNNNTNTYRITCITNTCQCVLPETPTPTPTSTPTMTPTPTQAPGAWIKLKDSSFNSTNSLTSKIPYVPAPFDSYDDDDQSPYFIIGSSGLVGAPVINLGLNASAKTGNPEWKATNLNTSYKMTPALFYSYIKARKEYKKINSLNEITADGIYYYQGTNPLTINSTPTEFNSFKIVLISPGTVNINSDLNGANLKSIAIIADTINFSSSTSQENGIFIANTITTGNNNILGLKINGNLIAQSVFTRERGWADLNRPSVFIVFKPNLYIDLLPYLSTANYEWRQLQ